MAVALGVLVATTTICALFLYAEAVSVAILRDRLARAHEDVVYDLLIKGEADLVDAARYRRMDETIAHQVQEIIGLAVTRSGRHGWSKSLLVVPPGQSPIGQRNQLPRTRFQFYAGVEDQVEVETVALSGLDLEVRQGEVLAIVGSSGSGKSTLLNMLGGLDRPTSGSVTVGGVELLDLTPDGLMRYRRDVVGFVWQQNARNLLPYLTALQNV